MDFLQAKDSSCGLGGIFVHKDVCGEIPPEIAPARESLALIIVCGRLVFSMHVAISIATFD